jgi:hypothetical protein
LSNEIFAVLRQPQAERFFKGIMPTKGSPGVKFTIGLLAFCLAWRLFVPEYVRTVAGGVVGVFFALVLGSALLYGILKKRS